MMVPIWFWIVVTFLLGITIGSFLNAVIYRLPRNLSMLEPRHSICPNCRHNLSALDLAPLFSFLLLKRRCRYCKTPISWRYFNIELLTGMLFVALYLRFPGPTDTPNCVALIAFAATLVPVYFIDLDTFTIPGSLNILLLLIPLARDAWGIAHHEAGHGLLWGWLPPSVLGALCGMLIFGAVRVAGWLWKGVEAMGLGDVLLARGMGAMLVSVAPPAGGALHGLYLLPIWVMFSCFAGIAAFPLLMWMRRRTPHTPETVSEAEPDEEPSSLGMQLLDIGWCLWLGDFVEYLRMKRGRIPTPPPAIDDGFVPAPTAIPFGPGLVIGFLAAVFVGAPLTAAYLAYALPKPPPGQ